MWWTPVRQMRLIAANQLRLAAAEPASLAVLLLAPLLFISVLSPLMRSALTFEGHDGVSGAAQSAPGMVTLFALAHLTRATLALFREHFWRTRARVPTLGVAEWTWAGGTLAVQVALIMAQSAVVFGIAGVVFDLRVAGHVPALAILVAATGLFVAALSYTLFRRCKSPVQAEALATVLVFVFGLNGGALMPTSLLPGWAQAIAPASPAYWAMRGYSSLFIGGGGVGDVLWPVASILALTAFVILVGALGTSRDDDKVGWA